MRVLREIATEVGKGLIAGFVGTVAMTIASTIEMKLRKRPPSTVPADAAGKVLHVAPRDGAGKQRFSNLVHYAYGTGWGLGRAALGAALCGATARGRRRSLIGPLAFFGAVWGASLVMLPRLGVAKPFWRWGAKAVAIDAFHHGVYAAATDGAYRLLGRV
jgi:hypothetical protein